MTTWYDPQEIKDQADGDQTQPEFTPSVDPDRGTVEGEPSEEKAALRSRIDDIRSTIDGFTQ